MIIAGFDLKDKIKLYLKENDYEVIDIGTNTSNDSFSYAKYEKITQEVLKDKGPYGIGVCGIGLERNFICC